jgi:hypothetical protein
VEVEVEVEAARLRQDSVRQVKLNSRVKNSTQLPKNQYKPQKVNSKGVHTEPNFQPPPLNKNPITTASKTLDTRRKAPGGTSNTRIKGLGSKGGITAIEKTGLGFNGFKKKALSKF